MKTTAIYTVRHRGQESHFYSYCAGGYSYPFYVAGWLERLDSDLNSHRPEAEKLLVAPLLTQLKGDDALSEAAKGLQIFRAIRDSEAAAFLDRTAEDERIPFHITLDVDQGKVEFAFNHSCPELDLPDLEIRIHSDHHEFCGDFIEECVYCEKNNLHGSTFTVESKEKVYEQLIHEYAALRIQHREKISKEGHEER